MKAVVFEEHGSTEVLKYQDLPMPQVSPNEVLIKVRAASANYNDIWARQACPVCRLFCPTFPAATSPERLLKWAARSRRFPGRRGHRPPGHQLPYVPVLRSRGRVLLPGLQDMGVSDRPNGRRALGVRQAACHERAAKAEEPLVGGSGLPSADSGDRVENAGHQGADQGRRLRPHLGRGRRSRFNGHSGVQALQRPAHRNCGQRGEA